MRRNHRIPSPTGFRGSDWLRILSMLGMLALLVLMMIRMRDPGMWKWIGGEESEVSAAAAPEQPALAAAPQNTAESAEPPGPPPILDGTELDPLEKDAFREEVQTLDDRGLYLRREEMAAYDRLVRWTVAQPFEVLRQRARGHVKLNDFFASPENCRGQLVRMKLNVFRAQKCEQKTNDGYQVHELWASPFQSANWLCNVIVVGFPQDMPQGERVTEQVFFAGYFLKLQGYYPAEATGDSRPLSAPLLIGRIQRVPPLTPELQRTDWLWLGYAAAGLAVLVSVQFGWMFLRRKRAKRSRTLMEIHAARWAETAPEPWLERDGEPAPGNNPPLSHDSLEGDSGRNGNGRPVPHVLGDGPGGEGPRNE